MITIQGSSGEGLKRGFDKGNKGEGFDNFWNVKKRWCESTFAISKVMNFITRLSLNLSRKKKNQELFEDLNLRTERKDNFIKKKYVQKGN